MGTPRVLGFPKNKREAKRMAHGIVWNLIESYFEVGQPYDDHVESVDGEGGCQLCRGTDKDDECKGPERLFEAMREIQEQHNMKSKGRGYP